MMKMLSILTCLVLLTEALPAQNETPVVVVASKGNVRYIPPTDAKTIKALPGAVVKRNGTIKMSSGATAVLYNDGRFQRLQGKGKKELSAVFNDANALSSLNFDPQFGQYVQAAVELTASKRGKDGWGTAVTDPTKSGDGWGTAVTDPTKSGDGWGTAVTDPTKSGDGWGTAVTDPTKSGDGWGTAVTDPTKSGDGWGGMGARITLILPYGKVVPETVTFSWSRPANATRYQLDILDDNKRPVHSATVTDTSAAIDLRKLNLMPGHTYSWKVIVPGSAEQVSGVRDFTVGTAEDLAKARKKAANSNIYPDGDPVLCGVMEAVALEKAEWYYEAAQTYSTLFRKYSSNNMLRMSYAAFWMRYRMEPKAKAVMMN